jgi:hypothetical protein
MTIEALLEAPAALSMNKKSNTSGRELFHCSWLLHRPNEMFLQSVE